MSNGVMMLALLLMSQVAYAEPISLDSAVKAILGEAGPSYAERRAIAFGLHNRGTLHGVYGRLEAPTEADYQQACRAWFEAQESSLDPVMGADHWLSDYDLKHCRPSRTAFRFKMKETAYVGTTHFYKES